MDVKKIRRLRNFCIIFGIIFATTLILGFFGNLGNNDICNRPIDHLLGCNAGFFGYDAFFEHLPSGIFLAILIVWLGNRFPGLNILTGNFWRNLFIILAIVALAGVTWEIWEFGHDHLLSKINYLADIPMFRLHQLAQPNNTDTMGDLTFNLIGGLLGTVALKISGFL